MLFTYIDLIEAINWKKKTYKLFFTQRRSAAGGDDNDDDDEIGSSAAPQDGCRKKKKTAFLEFHVSRRAEKRGKRAHATDATRRGERLSAALCPGRTFIIYYFI